MRADAPVGRPRCTWTSAARGPCSPISRARNWRTGSGQLPLSTLSSRGGHPSLPQKSYPRARRLEAKLTAAVDPASQRVAQEPRRACVVLLIDYLGLLRCETIGVGD